MLKKNIKISNIVLGIVLFICGFIFAKYFPYINNQVQAKEDLSLFWLVWDIMEERYPFEEPSSEDKIHTAIDGLVASYGDEFSDFLPPVETDYFLENITGSFAGIGAEITIREGFLTIIAPLKNSPAETYGLLTGDIITHVDEVDISGDTLDEAIGRIRGEEGTEVVLTVYRRREADPLDISIIRDIVTIPIVETDIQNEAFIIHLYNFNDNAEAEFLKALEEFKESGLDKLLIDVRNNPGGYLDASINISSHFLPQGTIILREEYGNDQESTIHRSLGYDTFDGTGLPEIIILQNGGSASASEIIAGAFQDNNIATVVGEQSYGKGSVQQLIDLPEGTALKVTIAKWLTPDKNHISKTGITPDVIIEADYSQEEDIQLQEALKLFN
ncbi:MAG: S41 family peptidase [Candidatus Pacebacteria bacterium]|nr:S41 family peptidase [Candidatus Paceibacterota bacterium]